MEKLNPKKDGSSKNILEENIEKLKKIFPEIITEEKVDFEKLKENLGEYLEDREESYNFTWNGKSNARRIAQTPSTGTLRPAPEESVNWNSTENLFIEGDNLEVLKLLQKSYHKKVKMIYIDPPYNTGQQFVYEDDFKDNIKNYIEFTGQSDKEGKKISVNAETSGRYHTNWLNMMYPRLKLARNLLKDNGVIFISIDDNEVANLKKICDEIFGEENFIAIITRIAKKGGNKGTFVKPKKDHVLFYFKDKLKVNPDEVGKKVDTSSDEKWLEEDFNEKKRKFKKGEIPYRGKLQVRPNQRYYIEAPDGSLLIPPGTVFPEIKKDGEMVKPQSEADKCWSWSRDRYLDEKAKDRFLFIKSKKSPFLDENGKPAKWSVYKKIFKEEFEDRKEILSDFLDQFENSKGARELSELKIPFDFPKPSSLIKYLAEILTDGNSIILDFFAGSATTAHAVLDLNKEDGGNRKFIMVQLPEETDKDSEARKAGYKTIADIGKERIRRVINNIKKESKNKKKEENTLFDDKKEGKDKKQLDLGFKVLKLDSSNIKPWEADFDNLEESLFDAVDNIKLERAKKDVLYELLLKYGLDLTVPIEERVIDDKKVYIIGAGALIVCLEDNISLDAVEGIAEIKEELKPELIRVVFKDSGFKDDVVKSNAVQILKQHGIEDVKSL